VKKEAVVPGPSSYELTFGSQCPEDPCPPFPRRPSVHRHLSRALPSDRSRGKLAPGARCHAAMILASATPSAPSLSTDAALNARSPKHAIVG